MAAEKQRKTFLSYSRVNKDFAIRLAKELKSEGFDIWLDQLDIPAGSRWDVEVERALEECEIFMIIMTPAAIASENVRDEIGYAIDNGKRFLPVLLENCNVPLRLRRFQYVDFTNKNFDDGVESAKELLRGLIAQPTIPRAEFTGSQVAEAARQAKEEADNLATQKVEEERLAKERAEMERRVKEEAERLYSQKAEEERLAKARADAERKAKTEARRKAKEEADRLATQKTEEERLAKQKTEEELDSKAKAERERKAREEADRLAAQKAEEELAAKAKVEANRLAAQKAEEERLAKQQADVLAAKAKADRLAAQKAEEDRLAKQKAEEELAAREESERKFKQQERQKPAPSTTTQKRPVSMGLLVGGMIACVLLVVAGIGISFFSNRDKPTVNVPAKSPTVSKVNPAITVQPTNTQKPTQTPKPTSTPIPNPVYLSASDTKALRDSDEWITFHGLASSQHTDAEINTYWDNNDWIPVTLNESKPVGESFGWCATTTEILNDNLKHITIFFEIDDSPVPEENIASIYSTADDGWKCVFKAFAISKWKAGEYRLAYGLIVNQAINDGGYDYDPGYGSNNYILITVP